MITSISIKRLLLLVVSLLNFTVPSLGLAGAWTQPPGTMYNAISANYFWTERVYDSKGNSAALVNNGKFEDLNFSWYQEFGITKSLTFFSTIPYKTIKYEDDNIKSRTSGVADIDFGLRFGLLENPIVVSIQGLVKGPWTYDRTDTTPLGNGQLDAEARLLLGRSLHPLPAYIGIETGYRYRDKSPLDEIRCLVELGLNLSSNLAARFKLDGIFGLDNIKDDDITTNQTLNNDYDLARLEATLSWLLTQGLTIELTWRPTIYGRNTAQGHTVSLGITTTWNFRDRRNIAEAN